MRMIQREVVLLAAADLRVVQLMGVRARPVYRTKTRTRMIKTSAPTPMPMFMTASFRVR